MDIKKQLKNLFRTTPIEERSFYRYPKGNYGVKIGGDWVSLGGTVFYTTNLKHAIAQRDSLGHDAKIYDFNTGELVYTGKWYVAWTDLYCTAERYTMSTPDDQSSWG